MSMFDDLIPAAASSSVGGGAPSAGMFSDLIPKEQAKPPSRFESVARDVIAASPLGPAVEIAKSFDPDLENSLPRAIASVPESARKVLENTYHAIRHPIDTASGIGKLAAAFVAHTEDPEMNAALSQASPETQKAFTEAMDARKAETQPILDAALKGIEERYGSYGAIKHTFETDPIGVAMDASIATPALSPLGVGGTVAGRGAAAVGRGIIEPVISHTLGTTTGAGADAVRAAARAGYEGGEPGAALTRQMRGAGDMNEPVNLARSAVGKLREERGAAYREGMAGVQGDTTVLDLSPIEGAIVDAEKVGSFKGVPLSEQVAETQGKISALFDMWKGLDPAEFHTAEGLDALKQAVGEIRSDTLPGTRSRVVADQVYNAVKDQIIQQAPAYAETMADYQKASEGIGEATKTMSLGEKASKETALRKLQSTMRDIVASNFGGRKKIGEILAEHEPALPYALAGQTLASPIPRGITARGLAIGEGLAHGAVSPATAIPALLASSPRLVGETVYLAGKAAGTIADVAKRFGVTAEQVRLAGMGAYQGGRMDIADPRAVGAKIMATNSVPDAIAAAESSVGGSDNEAVQQARRALANGVSRERVIAHLNASGISPPADL